jgi:nitrous oxidase accessory protein NosD
VGRGLGWALLWLWLACPAVAETLVVEASDWGTIDVPGARGAHAVGGGGLFGEDRSFFVFELGEIEAPVVAATLRLSNPGTFLSPDAAEQFAVYVGSEVNRVGAIGVTEASPPVLEIALGGPLLRIIERSGHRLFLNGRLATLDRPKKPRERLFDGTGAGSAPAPQLVVTTDPAAAPAPADTFFVDAASEVEPEAGTIGAPFQRVQDALSLATPGDVVEVAAGTYTGTVALRLGVELRGSGPEHSTLDFSGNSAFGVLCADDARLTGFRILDPRPGGVEQAAIDCVGASPEIDHNVIEVGARPALTLGGSEAWIHDNEIRGGPDESTPGIGLAAVFVAGGDPRIEGNEIAAPHKAVRFEGEASGTLCRNRLRGLAEVTTHSEGSEITVCDNLFRPSAGGTSRGGLVRVDPSEGAGSEVRVVGNSFHETAGVRALSGETLVANNLLVNGTAGIEVGDEADAEIRHNDVFGNRAGFMGAVTDYVNVASQTGTNGNVSVDPQFVDAFFEDFRLRSSSPAIDAGSDDEDDVESELDFDGDPRVVDGGGDDDEVVDIGAQEFQPDEALPEPALGIAVDVLPGRSPNELKFTKVSKGAGKVAVAILSDAVLDAPAEVDADTLLLEHEPALRCGAKDVDRDGARDLLCSFPLRGISTRGWPLAVPPACVRGETLGGRKLLGCDEVELTP